MSFVDDLKKMFNGNNKKTVSSDKKNSEKARKMLEKVEKHNNVYAEVEEEVADDDDVYEEAERFKNMRQVKDKTSSEEFKLDTESPMQAIILKNLATYSIYRMLLGLAVPATFCLLIVFVGLFRFSSNVEVRQYIQTDDNFNFVQDVSVNEPYVNDSVVLSKAVLLAKRLNTYSYINYREELELAQRLFTHDGWKSFEQAFSKAGNLSAIIQRKLIVKPEIKGEPVIDKKQLIADYGFVWKVIVPVEIQYIAPDERNTVIKQNGNVHVFFRRVSLKESPDGILAALYQFEEVGSRR